MIGEFIGDNQDVDFNRAESNLSKDKENEVAEADDGVDHNPQVADDINNT